MKKIIFIIVTSGVIGVNLSIFLPQIARSYRKSDKNMKRIHEIDVRMLTLNDQINEYTVKLKDVENSYYMERIGRDKLRMVKDGEKIYKLAK